MIVRLDREQQKNARRQLLTDVVYIISHDALKQCKSDGHTELTPVEIFLSAQKFCDAVFDLPDAIEGIGDEIDDLEDEASGANDTMFILLLATMQMQAISGKRVGIDIKSIIHHIFERISDHELFFNLFSQFANKEETRWMEGKKTNLLDYELQEIKFDGGDVAEMKGFVDEYVRATLKLTEAEIRSNLLTLGFINMEYGHVFDEPLKKLFDKLDMKITEIHNHFATGSGCQVFNGEVKGNFEKK